MLKRTSISDDIQRINSTLDTKKCPQHIDSDGMETRKEVWIIWLNIFFNKMKQDDEYNPEITINQFHLQSSWIFLGH